MQEIEFPVVRIVVRGCPSTRSEQTNVARARNMLLLAFGDNHWPGNAMFTVTPGGFVKAPFPDGWDGARGWASCPEDFQALVPHARNAVDEVLTPQVLDAARGRTEFLTLGVDLNDRSGKPKEDGQEGARHARGTRGHRRHRAGRAGAMDGQVLSGGLAAENTCPGSRPELAPVLLRSRARACFGMPRPEHVQRAGEVRNGAREPQAAAKPGNGGAGNGVRPDDDPASSAFDGLAADMVDRMERRARTTCAGSRRRARLGIRDRALPQRREAAWSAE